MSFLRFGYEWKVRHWLNHSPSGHNFPYVGKGVKERSRMIWLIPHSFRSPGAPGMWGPHARPNPNASVVHGAILLPECQAGFRMYLITGLTTIRPKDTFFRRLFRNHFNLHDNFDFFSFLRNARLVRVPRKVYTQYLRDYRHFSSFFVFRFLLASKILLKMFLNVDLGSQLRKYLDIFAFYLKIININVLKNDFHNEISKNDNFSISYLLKHSKNHVN